MCQITSSSFGPSGLNKLVVNQLDKLFLTNDAGTILRELEIEHPAARLILLASQQQEKEVGDGTNLVIVLAGEMLAQAEQLLRLGLKPSIIVEGYEAAVKRALELLDGEAIPGLTISGDDLSGLPQLLRTVVGSKQGANADHLASLIEQAVQISLPKDAPKEFNIDNVRCVKLLGGSFHGGSHVLRGMLLHREPETHVKRVTAAKVAVYACPLGVGHTETKGTVLLRGAQELLNFGAGEEKRLEEQIRAIAESGVKVVVTGDQVSDMALHFLNRHGLLALRIQSKFDLRRFCRATGSNPMARLGAPTAEEAGWADVVEAVEIGGQWCTLVRQEEGHQMGEARLSTIVLRGSTQNQLDDMERAIEDAVSSVRTALARDGRIVAGAGALEAELSHKLQAWGETVPGVLQYGIKAYGEAFETVPRILSANAGYNLTEALSKLSWAHASGAAPHTGIDVESGMAGSYTLDARAAGILDLLAVKRAAIQLATEAALTVLRVDQIIMAKPAGGPKPRAPGPQDADD